MTSENIIQSIKRLYQLICPVQQQINSMLEDKLIESETKVRYKSYHHLLKIILNICLCPFNFGFSAVYFNTISFHDIIFIYQIQGQTLTTVQGLLTGFLSFAAGLGAFWSSHLLNKLSRRQCFQFLSIFMIFVCFLLMIPNIYILFIVRLFQGFCIGMISAVSPLYIREFSPTELASILCPLNQIGIVFGITFSFILTFFLSLFMPAEIYWRIVFGFPILTSAILLYQLHYTYPYETPKWLLMNGKIEETKQLMRVIYKEEYVMKVYEQLQKALNFNSKSNEIELKNLNQNLNEKQQKVITKLQTNPLAIFSSYFLSFSQQMFGMGAIIAFSGQIVGEIFPVMQKIFPIFINMVALTGAIFCFQMLKLFGRMKTLLYGALITGTLLIILTYCFSNLNLNRANEDAGEDSHGEKIFICLILIAIRLIFSLSSGPVTWIYISETVQSNYMGYSTMVNWMTLAGVTTVFPIIKHHLKGDPTWIFLFYGLYTLFSYFVLRIVLIETQDKNEHQIMREYEQKWNKLKNK